MRRVVLAAMLVLAAAGSAQAQAAEIIDSYQLKFYAPGATAATQTETFQASVVQCNQNAPNGSSVNPTRAVWTDPNNAGKVCIYAAPAGSPLFSLPVGNWEATLSASNSAGGSPESARATFQRQSIPSTPTGVRFVR